jgi:hypothetical protein
MLERGFPNFRPLSNVGHLVIVYVIQDCVKESNKISIVNSKAEALL